MDATILCRFLAKIEVDPSTGCWLWTGARSTEGYARLAINRRPFYAHRLAYEHWVGPIPDGRELDHLCRVRHCVCPDHAEAVTHAENVQRGLAPAATRARHAAQTHCRHGHELTDENTYPRADGRRRCRRCALDAAARHRAGRTA